ncbi:copper amine oxidase N-terminal domain-containing protein [Paenibacillus flagellatus]|uniref:Copper amine oxidase-like N-terminal domain-containing protein n=1 Tax=Paenibacillus flagellatus TaxID=2211139 RepID=A0A2V5KHM1_9BACL|nr:copper amine oxidase N-terminal domain-containing protein [Paenibacillus flagellatus]PYI53830.1 hypothetical protein DLM86_14835 [Paenibacillus flagellatus]
MRVTNMISAVPMLLGFFTATAAAAGEPSTDPVQLLQFRSASSAEPVEASLRGADRFKVAWRLAEPSPELLQRTDDGTFRYRSGGRTYAVLPSGARTPDPGQDAKPASDLPDAPSPLVFDGNAVRSEAAGGGWTYTLPEGRSVLPQTRQTDARSNLYFQDDASNWYSLTASGEERFVLRLDGIGDRPKCVVAPSGDSACASPALGLIGLREKSDAPRLYMDGRETFFPMRPAVIDGVTYVPLRPIAETLKASVVWGEEDQSVTIKGERAVRLAIGRPGATVDGKTVPLEHPPLLIDDTTFVPLRFVGEALGETIIWEEATRTIQIASPQ